MKEIRKIIKAYDALDPQMDKVALASVVNVEESSYRRIGARMLVMSNGVWEGGISGGCLEGDALKRSQKAIFKNEPSRVVYDTMDDDDNQIGVGLGCNGRIEVLFTPIDFNDTHNEIEQLRQIAPSKTPSLMLKLIDTREDHPLLGKSYLLTEEELKEEYFGIAKATLQEHIAYTLKKRKNQVFNCASKTGANQRILIEFIRPETQLVLVGDNYDVNAFVGIAQELGWDITILCRRRKLSKAVYQVAKAVYEYEDADQIPINDYTAVVLMTHDYNWDKRLLPLFHAKQPAYLGMLGPKKRMRKMQAELPHIDLEDTDFFFSPVGLEIGAESPEEIALAVAAEIIAHLRGKEGKSLRYKEGTIHERV
jgi:xanthine dehydrogenase accessory factor